MIFDRAKSREPWVMIACGHNVYRAFLKDGRGRSEFYRGTPKANGHIWCFPHPSGASQYWNDPANVDRASQFLRRLLDRYGIVLDR